MAGIINGSINLSDIPKDKIIDGKKGKYLPFSITIKDEIDNFGNQGPIIVAQSKEEREAKSDKTYLGNIQVAWTNGKFPEPPPRDGQPQTQAKPNVIEKDDLPF
tara:strand:+ start:3108 stop:3419 length:312 start_codon:yes stop_codon:yes gene_type:complete